MSPYFEAAFFIYSHKVNSQVYFSPTFNLLLFYAIISSQYQPVFVLNHYFGIRKSSTFYFTIPLHRIPSSPPPPPPHPLPPFPTDTMTSITLSQTQIFNCVFISVLLTEFLFENIHIFYSFNAFHVSNFTIIKLYFPFRQNLALSHGEINFN